MGLDTAFLALLNATVTVEATTSEDAFGNSVRAAARTEKAYIEPLTSTFGGLTGTGAEQEGRVVTGSRLIMNYSGIRPGDRITLPGGIITYVTQVVTDKDEFGSDLFQTVTVEMTERG